MIRVIVRIQHRIYAHQTLAQGLQAKVWAGVDQDDLPRIGEHCGGASGTLIARIGRGACRTITAYDRRASAGAGAQHNNLHS